MLINNGDSKKNWSSKLHDLNKFHLKSFWRLTWPQNIEITQESYSLNPRNP